MLRETPENLKFEEKKIEGFHDFCHETMALRHQMRGVTAILMAKNLE